jgi:hypothetical protein
MFWHIRPLYMHKPHSSSKVDDQKHNNLIDLFCPFCEFNMF